MNAHSGWRALTILVILNACAGASAQNGSAFWAAWADHIRSVVNPSNDKGLDELTQIVASPIPLNWENKLSGKAEFCRFANTISKPGPTYDPSSAGVYKEYELFVQSIKIQPSANRAAVADAVEQAEDPSYLSPVKGDDGQMYSCPEFTYSPPFSQLVSQSARNRWELGNEQYVSSESTSHARLRVGPFVRSLSRSSGSRFEGNDITKVQIEYSLSRIVIQPGPWFSAILIQLFKGGPFKEGSSVGQAGFWGLDGAFPWLPREAIVAMNPRVVVSFTELAYARLKQGGDSIQEVDIGPFHFGKESRIALVDSSRTLTLLREDSTPFLVAVVNRRSVE